MKTENIKFKAKRLDGKGWIEGIPICINGKPYGIMIGEKESPDIDPSTICQFTGLKDCKGNEVWEGDMLSNVTNDSPDGIVVFKYGAFCLLAKNGRDFCVALTYLLSEKESLNRFKVIGNKFDKEK